MPIRWSGTKGTRGIKQVSTSFKLDFFGGGGDLIPLSTEIYSRGNGLHARGSMTPMAIHVKGYSNATAPSFNFWILQLRGPEGLY